MPCSPLTWNCCGSSKALALHPFWLSEQALASYQVPGFALPPRFIIVCFCPFLAYSKSFGPSGLPLSDRQGGEPCLHQAFYSEWQQKRHLYPTSSERGKRGVPSEEILRPCFALKVCYLPGQQCSLCPLNQPKLCGSSSCFFVLSCSRRTAHDLSSFASKRNSCRI